jgi:hypothetical protein
MNGVLSYSHNSYNIDASQHRRRIRGVECGLYSMIFTTDVGSHAQDGLAQGGPMVAPPIPANQPSQSMDYLRRAASTRAQSFKIDIELPSLLGRLPERLKYTNLTANKAITSLTNIFRIRIPRSTKSLQPSVLMRNMKASFEHHNGRSYWVSSQHPDLSYRRIPSNSRFLKLP